MPTVTSENRGELLREFYQKSDPEKLNIAIFSDCYYPLIGGITVRVHNQALALSKYANVLVVTGRAGKYSDDVPYPVLRCRGIRASETQGNIALPSMDFGFKKLLSELVIDAVHVHTYFGMNKAAHWLHKKTGVPVIQVSHQRLYPEYVNVVKWKFLARRLSNFSMRRMARAQAVWTVSENVRKFYIESGFRREMKIDPSGSDRVYPANAEARIAAVEEKFSIPPGRIVLLCLCRMEMKQKNLDFLLRAFRLARERGLEATLFMVGKGADERRLAALAEELGVSSDTVFTGFADDDTATGLYLRSDLFLFPSVFDNFGLTKSEAAALGTPTLALEGTAVAEGIEDGVNGFVSARSEEAFALRMLDALSDRDRLAEVSRNARESMGRSWEELAPVTLEMTKQECKENH